jgi:hypothetical protein
MVTQKEDWAPDKDLFDFKVKKHVSRWIYGNNITPFPIQDKELVWFHHQHFLVKTGEIWYHDLLLHEPDTRQAWAGFLGVEDDGLFRRKVYQLYDQGHAYLRVRRKEEAQKDVIVLSTNHSQPDSSSISLFLALKGMLFDSLITLRPSIWDSIEPYRKPIDLSEITIGIHTRHQDAEQDGSNVTMFASCLEEMRIMLGYYKPCSVYIASDRALAITNLKQVAENLNCSAISVDHTNEAHLIDNTETQMEHGAFAGLPFYKDFALLASQVRSGMIHSGGIPEGSSASSLIWQQIVYNSIQDGSIRHPPVDCSPNLGTVRIHVP